jgi:hypothetical protein
MRLSYDMRADEGVTEEVGGHSCTYMRVRSRFGKLFHDGGWFLLSRDILDEDAC